MSRRWGRWGNNAGGGEKVTLSTDATMTRTRTDLSRLPQAVWGMTRELDSIAGDSRQLRGDVDRTARPRPSCVGCSPETPAGAFQYFVGLLAALAGRADGGPLRRMLSAAVPSALPPCLARPPQRSDDGTSGPNARRDRPMRTLAGSDVSANRAGRRLKASGVGEVSETDRETTRGLALPWLKRTAITTEAATAQAEIFFQEVRWSFEEPSQAQ
jgi:hypothetical protein